MPHSNNPDNTILSQCLNRDKIRNIYHWISYFHKHSFFSLSSSLCLVDGDYVDYDLGTRYVQSIDWVSIAQRNNRSHHILEKYNHSARQSRANNFMFQFCEIKMTYIDIRVLGHSGERSWIKMEYPSEIMPLGIPNQTPACPELYYRVSLGSVYLFLFLPQHRDNLPRLPH